ncbi:hypothetical protein DV736_g6206, partial [Chaetothyriales sp. CBS 134916]
MGVFFTSQLPYTSDAAKLLLSDLWLFLECSIPTVSNYFGIPSVVWPLFRTPSGGLDELYFWSLGNSWCLFWHSILFVAQLIFIIGVPLSALTGIPFPPLLCTPLLILSSVGIYILNAFLCDLLLNGFGRRLFYSNGGYALDPNDPEKKLIPRDPQHRGERWIFMNGVSVGKHWLQGNLDLLAATFRRPILGIHNTTHGIPFDVLECIFQRTFSYATLDVRIAYAGITNILTDDSVTKVVLISHSQGAIEACLVLDWLYCTMSAAELQKLEIYTFGNAMNHWNCPSQTSGAPTIRHIEHYVNRWDWVSRFGILHFRPLSTMPDPVPNGTTVIADTLQTFTTKTSDSGISMRTTNKLGELILISRKKRTSTASLESKLAAPHRFAGRLFLQDAPGHMLNQHYFDSLFPMNWVKSKVVTNTKNFMEQPVDESALLADNTVKPRVDPMTGAPKHGVGKIGDKSRLFQYVNGNVPKEK